MNKVKTLIIYKDVETNKKIVDLIKANDNYEIIGTETDAEDALNEIIDKKPEFIFIEYEQNSMNDIEFLKKLKEKNNQYNPIFNFIVSKKMKAREIEELIKVAGKNKINALIIKPFEDKIKKIMNEYINLSKNKR